MKLKNKILVFIKKFWVIFLYSILFTVILGAVYLYIVKSYSIAFDVIIPVFQTLISILTFSILYFQFKRNSEQIELQRKSLESQMEIFNYSKKANFQIHGKNYPNKINHAKVHNFGQSVAYAVTIQFFLYDNSEYVLIPHTDTCHEGKVDSNGFFEAEFSNPKDLPYKISLKYKDLSTSEYQYKNVFYPKNKQEKL